MVEKLHNQETYLTRIRPEHQHEHHKSRETIAFLKEKIIMKKSELDQDLEFKKINADRDVMLAKAPVDALNRERSQKHKIESFSKSYMEEKEFLCKIIENNPEGSYFCEKSACEMCRVIYAKANGIFLEFAEIAWTTKIVERVVHSYSARYRFHMLFMNQFSLCS